MKQSAKAKNKVRNQKKDMTSMAEKPDWCSGQSRHEMIPL